MTRRGIASALGLQISWVMLLPAAGHAQLAGGLSVTSDVRNRGLSLNGGGPALSANLSFDHASGVYAGASVTGGDTRRFGARFLGHSEAIGYAARLGPKLSWDVGVSNTQIDSNVYTRFSAHYTEIYAGLSSAGLTARVAFTPDYLVRGLSTIYLDITGVLRPARHVRVFGHAGVLVPLGDPVAAVLPRARYDLRIGIAAELKRSEVQLAWVRSGAGADYLASRRQSRDALVIGATWFF